MGAHYLLTMLARVEPRGLPGTTIDRIEMQRAEDGFPLDDVIVHAHENTTGRAATLQIQVKRSISFSPADTVFKKVVGQIAKAIKEPAFWSSRNELAIATARTSRKIDGAYQDILKWARQLSSAKTFFDRLGRPGSANDDMRAFVRTFREHLRDACAPDDNETVWKVLGRLQILVFDYTTVGSSSDELARERAVRVLPPEDATGASGLWSTLTDLALEVAADGGDRDHTRLIEDLRAESIRIAGDRRLANVRAAVAEGSRLALADMEDRISATTLTRLERVEAVNEALDKGRYVEIRGDAGVGKSGVLKHFAERFGAEGRIVVLSPGRTPQRGWTAMRGQLGFDGTARELLADLATDGGAALFIDNLDSFDEDERRTVNDLVREAATISGISVVVTARRNFGVDEPGWLDADAIKYLKPAPPILIEELSPAEVAELSEAEPHLAGLLADDHPAREVVRNLYRLSRLAHRPESGPMPTTELDMAEQWWTSADGERDASHRERARLLRHLTEKALSGIFVLDVKDEPPAPIDALIASETLRDLGNDLVAFRHDVLRQWAIGNLIAADLSASARLPLDKPASAIMARGVELATRIALERESDGTRWAEMLANFTGASINGSWRRAVLLALVHSESSVRLMDREADRLLANDAALLCELIRTVMAVDVEPASQLLVQLGVDPVQIPPGMFVPTGASWVHLIVWLLKLGTRVPANALGDVAEFYWNWMLGTFGHGSFAANLLAWLHAWLVELEESGPGDAEPRTYAGKVGYRETGGLLDKLRIGFLMFSNKVPALAADYLNRVRAREHNRGVVSNIMKFRGTLAQAAPIELAALTAEALIATRKDADPNGRAEREEPFQFLDHEFLPASPAQGPFLDLLTHAPEEGLSLVRKLVDHAIQFSVRGNDPGEDGFRVQFDEEERFFPWAGTYRWSRGESGAYAMTSGLMALEAWAHRRIEGDEDIRAVLKDILGPPGTSAAFVLIAVDMIISHWPKSQGAAGPFLGCPELLSLDRTRQTYDQIKAPDFFGLKALEKEPPGTASRADLKKRPSRRVPLEHLIGTYACSGPEDLRAKIEQLLHQASQRLGSPEADSTFADPRLLARHALNLVDPKNWPEQELARPDGTKVQGRQYVSPEDEASHVAALNAGAAARFAATNIRVSLSIAIDDPSKSSPEIAAQGVAWAQAEQLTAAEEDENDSLRDDALRAAALITIRDGGDELSRQHGAWAEQILTEALTADYDVAHRMRGGLKFNPLATAFAGFAEIYRREPTPARLRVLLKIAARESPAGAHGFAIAAAHLAQIDERILKAIMRCAFAAAVKPVRQRDLGEVESTKRAARYSARISKAVEDELAWIEGTAPEPNWPVFPAEDMRRRRRRRIRISGAPYTKPDEAEVPAETHVDNQAAALWIRALKPILDVSKRPWLRCLARAYADFSAKLNGHGLDPGDELDRNPTEWNASYYELVASALPGLPEVEIEELALAKIIGLPDASFFEVMPQFLRAIDVIYFDDCLLEAEAPLIRQRFIDRLVVSSGWRHLVNTRSASVEVRLGPCVGTIFFNNYLTRQTGTYLTPQAIERIGPFLPKLTELLVNGPSYFSALVAMDLLEVSPRPSLLPLLIAGAKSWLGSYADDTGFWVGHNIGRRFCGCIDRIRLIAPDTLAADKYERQEIDSILAALVRLGLPEARQLETEFAEI